MTRENVYIYIENTYGIGRQVVVTWFKYLDELAASNVCDLVDAPSYLISNFGISQDIAVYIVNSWATTNPN